MVRRAHLAHCGLVYELTEAGRSLEPVVLALARWGLGVLDEPEPSDAVTPEALAVAFRAAFRPDSAALLPPTTYAVRLRGVAVVLAVSASWLDARPLGTVRPVDLRPGAPAPEPDLRVEAGPGLFRVLAGGLTPSAEDAAVVVTAGDPALLDLFFTTFSAAARPPHLLPTLP